MKATLQGAILGLPLIAFGLWDLNTYVFGWPIPASVFWSVTLPLAMIYYFAVGILLLVGVLRIKVKVKK